MSADVEFPNLITRTYEILDLSVRRGEGGDGRTVFGRAAPYGESARIRDFEGEYAETLAQGMFKNSVRGRPQRFKLMKNHHRHEDPLGATVALREAPGGLEGEWRVARGPIGDQMLTYVEDGVYDSFSVSYIPLVSRWSDKGRVEGYRYTDPAPRGAGVTVLRQEGQLIEISLVHSPAYIGAAVAGIRSTHPTDQSDRDTGDGPGVTLQQLTLARRLEVYRQNRG